MISLAAGEVSEQSLARWIRDNWPTPKAGELREETTSPGCTSIR
jgi:hypothetical protein